MRKPSLKPSNLSREELLERRVSDLERMLRRMPVRSVSSGTDQTATVVNQTTHALAVGNTIRHNGTSWVKSQADTAANAIVGGIVIAVLSPDVFVLATAGYVAGLSGLTAGSVHYLSATTAGLLTTTAPSIEVQVLHADTTTSGVLVSMRVALNPFSELSSVASYVSGTGTWAKPANRNAIALIIGGGGGSSSSGASTITGYYAGSSGGSPTSTAYLGARSQGGGGGASRIVYIEPSVTSIDYSVGAGGSGGGAPGGAGDGGTSFITISGTVLSAAGGQAGSDPALYSAGGAGGVAGPVQGVAGKHLYSLGFSGHSSGRPTIDYFAKLSSAIDSTPGAPAALHNSYGKGGNGVTAMSTTGVAGASGAVLFYYDP